MAERKDERNRGPERLGDVLSRWMKESGLLAESRQNELVRAWRDVVGSTVATHTKVRSLRGGVLTVEVDSAPLRQELEIFQREELLLGLRERLRGVFLEDLRFTLI